MTVPVPKPDLRPLRVFGLTLAVLASTFAGLAAAAGSHPATVAVGVVGFGAFAVMALVSVGFGLRAVFGPRPMPSALGLLTMLGPVAMGAAMSFFGAFMALRSAR